MRHRVCDTIWCICETCEFSVHFSHSIIRHVLIAASPPFVALKCAFDRLKRRTEDVPIDIANGFWRT